MQLYNYIYYNNYNIYNNNIFVKIKNKKKKSQIKINKFIKLDIVIFID